MFSRITGYFLLYTISFGFFTAIFHTLAFADLPSVNNSATSAKQKESAAIKPTPTIYIAPTKTLSPSPSITEGSKLNSIHTESLDVQRNTIPSMTAKLLPSDIPIASPTAPSTPTPTILPTSIVIPPTTAVSQLNMGGMSAEKLFDMANAHRKSLGISELKRDDRTCALATARAGEIKAELENGSLHSGMYGRNLPYWNTENAIAMGPEETAFAWWLSDYIHRKAIENPTYTTSCTACSEVYCVQEFTSYQPK